MANPKRNLPLQTARPGSPPAPSPAVPAGLDERCAAYARMADALEAAERDWRDSPDLAACAQRAGLSPSHFQREFSRWAGLSPRQFRAAMAHAEAGARLREGISVLEATLDAGLSSPGRLHDLFIAHEGLSPGEAASGGADITLKVGRAPTPFGPALWAIGPRGLVYLGFIDGGPGAGTRTGFVHPGYTEAEARQQLRQRYPRAAFTDDDAPALALSRAVFERGEPLPVCLYGTPFRRQIWRALLEIPAGAPTSYGAVAAAAGRPKAARAAGAAIGANPVSWFIPCHRAISASGALHNYHWGLPRKRAMLAYERAHTLSQSEDTALG